MWFVMGRRVREGRFTGAHLLVQVHGRSAAGSSCVKGVLTLEI